MGAVVIAGLLLTEYGLLVLAVLICAGTMREFFRVSRAVGARPLEWYPLITGTLAVAGVFFIARGDISSRFLVFLIPLVAAVFVCELFRKKDNPLINIAAALMGLVYVAVPLCLLCVMAFMGGAYDPRFILAVLVMIVANDVFAYAFGVTLGRHKFFERVSPKKSWEGFFGGLIFAVGAAVLCGHILGGNLVMWGGAGLVTVAGAVFGDLVESLFKRSASIKDSGTALPGHGGLLDRLDSILFAVPLVYVYFTIFA